jgi:hypothetical protein
VTRRRYRRSAVAFRRLHGVGLALGALLAGLAQPAAALLKLSIPDASERSLTFARNTCDRDKHCVRYGVKNCRRGAPRVVLCRIFDERHTDVQGRYRCHRLIRLGLDPRTRRIPVTGIGRWHC